MADDVHRFVGRVAAGLQHGCGVELLQGHVPRELDMDIPVFLGRADVDQLDAATGLG
jgi:hypothetical protein